jgi:hypothetical protein
MSEKSLDDQRETDRSALLDRFAEDRRAIVKTLLAAAGVYAVPLMASFPMSGLRLGTAEADVPPGLSGGNQLPPGVPFQHGGFDPPGRTHAGNQFPF